jgi:chorismate mutase
VVNQKDIQQGFRSLSAFLDERIRRLVAAAESKAIGYGGISVAARATAIITNLIAATPTTAGLAVKRKLDTNVYPAGVKVSDQQMPELRLRRDHFHGDWNYSLLPRS